MQRYALFASPAKLFGSFFILGVTFFATRCGSAGREVAFFGGRGHPAGPRGASPARRKGGMRWWERRREGVVKVREGRGGLRQASLMASARVRVFNLYFTHGGRGDWGRSPLSLRGGSGGIRREYVFLTYISRTADGEMAYPMMPRINPKRSLKRLRLIPDSGLMETGRETVS